MKGSNSNNALDFLLGTPALGKTLDIHIITLTGGKLTFGFSTYMFVAGPPPLPTYIHLAST